MTEQHVVLLVSRSWSYCK